MSSEVWNDPKPRTTRIQSLPTISSIQLTHLYGKAKFRWSTKTQREPLQWPVLIFTTSLSCFPSLVALDHMNHK